MGATWNHLVMNGVSYRAFKTYSGDFLKQLYILSWGQVLRNQFYKLLNFKRHIQMLPSQKSFSPNPCSKWRNRWDPRKCCDCKGLLEGGNKIRMKRVWGLTACLELYRPFLPEDQLEWICINIVIGRRDIGASKILGGDEFLIEKIFSLVIKRW